MLNLYNKLRHEMIYSKVMKQSKTYGLNTVFIGSLEFLEHGYCESGGVRTPCVNVILCLINNKRDILSDRWRRPHGGVL